MKVILAAIDGAPSASEVLTKATELALGTRARLVLFRTADVPFDGPDESIDEKRFDERLRAAVMSELEAARARLPAELDCTLRVGTHGAARSIVSIAREEGADLVIIGAHGAGPLKGGLGSVTAQVLELSDRDVLVVKRRAP